MSNPNFIFLLSRQKVLIETQALACKIQSSIKGEDILHSSVQVRSQIQMATFLRTSYYPGNVLDWDALKNSSVSWKEEAINLIESAGVVDLLSY